MTRDELAEIVLLEVAERCHAVRCRPKPPTWKYFEIRDYEADLANGPTYSPSEWFPALTGTEAGRVRVLRTLYRLDAAGLLVLVKSEGGRLERVEITDAGSEAVEAMRKADRSEADQPVAAE